LDGIAKTEWNDGAS
jgi:hypothetical protein